MRPRVFVPPFDNMLWTYQISLNCKILREPCHNRQTKNVTLKNVRTTLYPKKISPRCLPIWWPPLKITFFPSGSISKNYDYKIMIKVLSIIYETTKKYNNLLIFHLFQYFTWLLSTRKKIFFATYFLLSVSFPLD